MMNDLDQQSKTGTSDGPGKSNSIEDSSQGPPAAESQSSILTWDKIETLFRDAMVQDFPITHMDRFIKVVHRVTGTMLCLQVISALSERLETVRKDAYEQGWNDAVENS